MEMHSRQSLYEIHCMSMRGPLLTPGKVERHDGCARRSKCCSPTSSAFSSWTDCDYVDQMVHATKFLFAATAQNLRKLAKLIPMPQPKPA